MTEMALDPRLEGLVRPYFPDKLEPDASSFLVADLKVTGSDYLDFVNDVERIFDVDLHAFLVGANPAYVSTGLAGIFTGETRKPVYRDFTIAELNDFLTRPNLNRD